MKKTGICPKCGCEEIVVTRRFGSSIDNGRIFRPGRSEVFVCTDCGYVEEYLIDLDRLARSTKRWRRP